LSDGEPHTLEELKACVDDELSSNANVRQHISGLRKKLGIASLRVVCEVRRGVFLYKLEQL